MPWWLLYPEKQSLFIVKRQYGTQKDFQGQQEIAATLCFIFPKKAKRKKKSEQQQKITHLFEKCWSRLVVSLTHSFSIGKKWSEQKDHRQ